MLKTQLVEILNIINKSKYNPFNNIIIFGMFPAVFNIFNAIFHRAVYMTSDDSEMRFVIDGTLAGKYLAEPSEFSLYMGTLYGKILKFFYEIYPKGYWYDIFTYIFICFSLYIITISCCKNFSKETIIKKILVLTIVSMVFSHAFLTPQFTITSGMLAISGVLAFYMLVNSYFNSKKAKFLCGLYCIVALFFSSVIRFECCMICAFYTGIVLLPHWPFLKWQNILKRSWVVIIALFAIGAGIYADYILIHKTPHWDDLRESNEIRVEIADKTDMWNHIYEPWINNENKIGYLKLKDYSFSKGDYRLLLSYLPFGNTKVFNLKNMKKVEKELAPKVQTNNCIKAGFRIEDYRNNFPYFFGLFLTLSLIFMKQWKKSSFIVLSFFVLVVLLNCAFRALPYRLWYNFATTVVVALMLPEIKYPNKNKILNIFVLCMLAIACFYSYMIMKHSIIFTQEVHNIFKLVNKDIRDLSKKYIYMTNYSFNEHIVAPFRENIFYKNKTYHYGWLNMAREKMLKDHNISETDTWLDICQPDNKFRFLASPYIYNPYIDIKKAVSYFIKEKYGKTVAWVANNPTPNLITYQCRILTDKELWLRKKYKEEVRDIFNTEYGIYLYAEKYGKNIKEKRDIINYLYSVRTSDWRMLKVKFARKYLGKNATPKQIEKFLDFMEVEVIKENSKED